MSHEYPGIAKPFTLYATRCDDPKYRRRKVTEK